ncbi:M23 family metallopeptidase [Dactylosporangium sp. CA-152071]|uniref:M23 family metallopeptidase n=1 Tax=Dactylosporangium sp. CA-152071 TaxID=3239933 RepID=UPI003D9109F6
MKRVRAAVVAVVIVIAGSCVLLLGSLGGGDPAYACTPPRSGALVAVRTGGFQAVGVWKPDRVANAAIIVKVGADRGVPPRGWVIAVATAMVESSLINTDVVTDHDSVGLFQQRPSQGWGTPAQLIDPVYAASKFYDALLKVDGWDTMPLTKAAQVVQRSEYPTRYAAKERDAEQVVAYVTQHASITELAGASPAGCAGPVALTSSGWTKPVEAKVGSGWGQRSGRLHAGVDLIAGRYKVIRAASAGEVVQSVCDRSTGNCDVDGSPEGHGCGWYVDIRHADGIATRYCHMVRRPDVTAGQRVTAGQPIGLVGTSGHSSGTHLHYEVHRNVPCAARGGRCTLTGGNSIDPEIFMDGVGVCLGEPVNPRETPRCRTV